MASGGEELNSPGFHCRNNSTLCSVSGTVPAPPPESPSESRAWSRAYQRVKPIWKLERKHASQLPTGLRPRLLRVSPRAARFSCSRSLSSSGSTSGITDHDNSNYLGSLPGLFSSALLYQQSDNTHKTLHQSRSFRVHSNTSDKRPFSVPQKRIPASANYNKATSSTVFPTVPSTDPCLSLQTSGRKPFRRSLTPAIPSRIPSPLSLSKSTLNSNIFMKPNVVKVPFSEDTGSLKPVSSAKTHRVFLHHLGITGNCAAPVFNHKMPKCIRTVIDDATARITLPTPASFTTSTISVAPSQYNQKNLGTRAEPRPWKLDDNSNSQALQKEPQFTETVRKLAAKDTEKKPQQGCQPGQASFGNSSFQWSLLTRSRRWKPPLVCQQVSQQNAGSDKKIFPGASDTAGLDSITHCTKRSNIHLVASHTNRLNPSPACGSVFDPLPVREDRAPILPILPSSHQLAGRAEVATGLASIHLGQTRKEEREENTPLDLPAVRLDNHCQPNQTEAEDTEELVDELEVSSCHDENEKEEGDERSPLNSESPKELMAAISHYSKDIETKAISNPEKAARPALTSSLFFNVPPTIYFGTQNERVEKLPWHQRKLLRWKMSVVTPSIVKQTIERSHFSISNRNDDWLGCWGRHMKCTGFRTIRDHQKFNHFPGSFQIGRKDQLWCNLSRMQNRFGKKEFSFFPQSFILPQDSKALHKIWENNTCQKWIVKPPASARGVGIQVIHQWSQLPKRRPLLVQRYLHKPYLINGRKFDLRIYVYVTSYDPLRIYLFSDGLARFASCKYSSSLKSLGNKYMHLTNYSINRRNTEYQANADETACQGHKWALKALWKYLNQKGIRSDAIWKKIKDIVIKTIISSEPYVTNLLKIYVRRSYNCHELFGFDIMLDENLKPWVLEVNISPSLHSNSALDISIKGQMIRDLLNLAGFVLPNTEDISSTSCTSSSFPEGLSSCPTCPSTSEYLIAQKMKKAYYLAQKVPDQKIYESVLDILTSDDIRVLVEMEDEFSRRGQFERIFPSHTSFCYLRFFEQQRYFNILATQWEQKYHSNRDKAIDLLRHWCFKGFHMGVVAGCAPLWSKPTPLPSDPKRDEMLSASSKPDSGKQEKTSTDEDREDTSKEPDPSI